MKFPKVDLHKVVLAVAKYVQDKSIYRFGDKKQYIFIFPIYDWLFQNHTLLQLVEFLIIGLLGLIPNSIVFAFWLGFNPFVAWFLGFLSGALFKFFFEKWFVFTPRSHDVDVILLTDSLGESASVLVKKEGDE